jgi:hypothetical protein
VPKRFTDTLKWQDAFFRELSPGAKLAYSYMLDNCDNSGVWDPDFRLATYCIKLDLDWDSILAELGNRVEKLRNGKLFLTRFVRFQYSSLNPTSPPHSQVIRLLAKHGIPIKKCYDIFDDETAGANGAEPKGAETAELPGIRPKPEERDLLFEALAQVDGADVSRLTAAGRGRLNKFTAEIRKVEPTAGPERVKMAKKNWEKKGYSAPASASVLASHWSELTLAPAGAESAEARSELARMAVRLEELSYDSGGKRVARSDLSADEKSEYGKLAVMYNALSKRIAS